MCFPNVMLSHALNSFAPALVSRKGWVYPLLSNDRVGRCPPAVNDATLRVCVLRTSILRPDDDDVHGPGLLGSSMYSLESAVQEGEACAFGFVILQVFVLFLRSQTIVSWYSILIHRFFLNRVRDQPDETAPRLRVHCNCSP